MDAYTTVLNVILNLWNYNQNETDSVFHIYILKEDQQLQLLFALEKVNEIVF